MFQIQQKQETVEFCCRTYSETCVIRLLSKRPQIGFQDQLSLNAGQKYCKMLQGEHSAKLSTFINLPFAIKIFILSIFEWPFYTGFTELIIKYQLWKVMSGNKSVAAIIHINVTVQFGII